jgi:hypothetical protein
MEAEPLILGAGTSHRAITERILEQAGQAGFRAALIDATDGSVTAWPRFARTVLAAAHGLSRRGLAEGDTAGVFVEDAASFAIAVNAIRAAGAIATPIGLDRGPADIAARLNARGARLLITSARLAELAAEAADRSRVRQVIAFGEAYGTTPFSSLLESARHATDETALAEHGPSRPSYFEPAERGKAGRPPPGAAAATGASTWPGGAPSTPSDGDLTHRDLVVAAPPCGDGNAYMSLLDLTLLAGATLVAAPLPLVTAAMRAYKGTAAIVPRGTEVPGIPPARVFAVGLQRWRWRWRRPLASLTKLASQTRSEPVCQWVRS